jgi:hypothetical protein
MHALGCILMVGVLAGCSGEPDDVFYYSGRVVDEHGQPLAGRAVRLSTAASEYCWNAGAMAASPFEAPFQSIFETKSDAKGQFLLEPMRFQLGDESQPACAKLELDDTQPHRRTAVVFTPAPVDQSFVDNGLWTGQSLATEERPDGFVARLQGGWPFAQVNVPGTPFTEPKDDTAQRYYRWSLRTPDGLAWTSSDEAAHLPLEALEDFGETRLVLESWTQAPYRVEPGPLGSVPIYQHARASGPSTAVTPRGGVPVSRRAECWYFGQPFIPCTFTDGKLERAVPLEYERGSFVGPDPTVPVRVRLPSPRGLRALVVRGVTAFDSQSLDIEGTADGSTWVPLGTLSLPVQVYDSEGRTNWEIENPGSFRIVTLDPSAGAVQEVRLRGAHVFRANELSLFE